MIQSQAAALANYESRLVESINALKSLLADKFGQAIENGATEEQAIVAVRALWLEAASK